MGALLGAGAGGTGTTATTIGATAAGQAATPAIASALAAGATAAGTTGAAAVPLATSLGSVAVPATAIPAGMAAPGSLAIPASSFAGNAGWVDSLMTGVNKVADSPVGKIVQGQLSKENQTAQAPALGGMAPRSGTSAGQQQGSAEDQMNAILGQLFRTRGA